MRSHPCQYQIKCPVCNAINFGEQENKSSNKYQTESVNWISLDGYNNAYYSGKNWTGGRRLGLGCCTFKSRYNQGIQTFLEIPFIGITGIKTIKSKNILGIKSSF